ncbi:hypothetical protein JW977_00750 [Candidatus Falkowbacteria bacterium]|nr:hypothetical protein [Candidatus Falkowbacteria bacterium]
MHWEIAKLAGQFILVGVVVAFLWFLWHTLAPIICYYFDFYMQKWFDVDKFVER